MGQPIPRCRCGSSATWRASLRSPASVVNLLPYWLTRYPDQRAGEPARIEEAAKALRSWG